MSGIGVSALALAVVYAMIGLHALMLLEGRSSDRAVLTFALVCLSMGGYAGASALLAEATTVSAAVRAQTLQLLAASTTAAFYVSFSCELRPGRHPRAQLFGYALPLIVVALAAAGLLVRARTADTGAGGTLGYAPGLLQVELAPGGHLVQAWLVVVACCAIYLAYSGADPHRLRPAPWAPALVLAAVVYDIAMEALEVDTLYASEYAFLALAVAGSERLIARGQRTADALEQRTRELEASSRRIEATKQELVRREQLAAVGEVSAIVAHELRNPLAIVHNATASLARQDSGGERWSTLLDVIDDETVRLDRLVTDLVAYSQPMAPRLEELDGSELLSMVAQREQRSSQPGAIVQLELCDRGARFRGDAELLCQALCNLIDNARNAMPGGGRITVEAVTAELDDAHASLLRVHDDGPGIPEPVLARVRELFFTTRPEGTGLGLAIVERVAAVHGGSVEIDSEAGRGTTVTMRLPAAGDARGRTRTRAVAS